MSVEKIEHLEDPRLTQYRDIRNKSHYRTTGYFVAEGWRVVERMLNSPLTVQSILVSERRADLMLPRFADRAEVYVLPDALARELVGYNFHAGVLGVGLRPGNPALRDMLSSTACQPLIVCCPHLTGPDNLGSLIRLSSGFGVSGILLGPGSVDPYLRRCVRVSMGTIFQLPIRISPELRSDLLTLREDFQYRLLAAEKTETSRPLREYHHSEHINHPRVLLLGNEAEGLDECWLELVERIYHIPMASGVESLNITHAAGIFLYEMTHHREDRRRLLLDDNHLSVGEAGGEMIDLPGPLDHPPTDQ